MCTRAAILSTVIEPLAIGDVEIGSLVRRGPGPVVASGVCHTDVSAMHGLMPVPLPAILGHEGRGSPRRWGRGHEAQRRGSRIVGRDALWGVPRLSGGRPFVCHHLLALAFGGPCLTGRSA